MARQIVLYSVLTVTNNQRLRTTVIKKREARGLKVHFVSSFKLFFKTRKVKTKLFLRHLKTFIRESYFFVFLVLTRWRNYYFEETNKFCIILSFCLPFSKLFVIVKQSFQKLKRIFVFSDHKRKEGKSYERSLV